MISAYPQNNRQATWWGNTPQNGTVAPPQQPTVGNTVPQTEGQFQTIDGVTWVQGENAAKAYTVFAGKTVMLLDSESDRFYIKQADPYGRPLPLRCYHYSEDEPEAEFVPENYVTRKEFEELKNALDALRTPQNTINAEGE